MPSLQSVLRPSGRNGYKDRINVFDVKGAISHWSLDANWPTIITPKVVGPTQIVDGEHSDGVVASNQSRFDRRGDWRLICGFSLHRSIRWAHPADRRGIVVRVRRMLGLDLVDGHVSTRRGVLLGVTMSVLVGLAIYPLRRHDYELQFLLVLPVVYAGVWSKGVSGIASPS